MKKYILVFLLLIGVNGCTYYDQIVHLDFNLKDHISDIGHGRGVEIKVSDNRRDVFILGHKDYYVTDILRILPSNDVRKILKEKLTRNLYNRGFNYGWDRMIELKIEDLSYEAKAGIIGTSKITGDIKVVVTNNKNGAVFSKHYRAKWSRKHFVMPLESTVDEDINNFLHEIMRNIIFDDNFVESLIK